MGVSRLLLLLGFLVLYPGRSAAGSPEPPRPSEKRLFAALAAGMATALVPMAVGAGLIASSPQRQIKHAGLDFIGAGLVLGPLFAHAAQGEAERGALFSLPTLLFALGTRCVLAAAPEVVEEAAEQPRYAFFALISLSVGASAFAFIDSFMAGERLRRRKIQVLPTLGPKHAGVLFGGTL